jgi:hypothetical protein
MEETEGGWPINSVIPRGDNLTFSRSENIHLSLALLNYLNGTVLQYVSRID